MHPSGGSRLCQARSEASSPVEWCCSTQLEAVRFARCDGLSQICLTLLQNYQGQSQPDVYVSRPTMLCLLLGLPSIAPIGSS